MNRPAITLIATLLFIPLQSSPAVKRQVVALLAGDNINLRSKPSLNSRILARLPLVRHVRVIKRLPSIVTIAGKRGQWSYVEVDTEKKGWVFDYYLAYDNRLRRVFRWRRSYIKQGVGDVSFRYDIYTNGLVKIWFYSFYRHKYPANVKPFWGYLYRYLKAFRIMAPGKDFRESLWLVDGKLRTMYGGEGEEIIIR